MRASYYCNYLFVALTSINASFRFQQREFCSTVKHVNDECRNDPLARFLSITGVRVQQARVQQDKAQIEIAGHIEDQSGGTVPIFQSVVRGPHRQDQGGERKSDRGLVGAVQTDLFVLVHFRVSEPAADLQRAETVGPSERSVAERGADQDRHEDARTGHQGAGETEVVPGGALQHAQLVGIEHLTAAPRFVPLSITIE